MSTVAVISHIWLGHIPTYHRLLVERLALAGHRVISLAPCAVDDLELSTGVCTHSPFGESPAALHAAANAIARPSGARRILDATGVSAALRRSGVVAAWRSAMLWRRTARALETGGRRCGAAVDLVVLVYPEVGYLSARLPAAIVPWLLPSPWTGIWNGPAPLHAGSSAGAGRLFRARNCRAVLVPDTHLRDQLRAHDSALRVLAMPEIADLRPPALDHPQVRRLLGAAAGRRVVGLLGNITRRKGIFPLLEMAAIARAERLPLFFVAAGDFSVSSCGGVVEYEEIAAACSRAPDNFLLLPDRIMDGPVFNAHLDGCDIVFAAYIDFPFQSNLLTKAAAFSKPVVVSRGHIMEQRTIEYGLGVAVPQGDARAALDAIQLILAGAAGERSQRRNEYLRENGTEALDRLLITLLDETFCAR